MKYTTRAAMSPMIIFNNFPERDMIRQFKAEPSITRKPNVTINQPETVGLMLLQQLVRFGDHILDGKPELFKDDLGRSGRAVMIDSNNGCGVSFPAES